MNTPKLGKFTHNGRTYYTIGTSQKEVDIIMKKDGVYGLSKLNLATSFWRANIKMFEVERSSLY